MPGYWRAREEEEEEEEEEQQVKFYLYRLLFRLYKLDLQLQLGRALESGGRNVLGKIQQIVFTHNNTVQTKALPSIAPSDLFLPPAERTRANATQRTSRSLIGATVLHRRRSRLQRDSKIIWHGLRPKFHKGDRVRIDQRRIVAGKDQFAKISDRTFTEQVYTVTEVHSVGPLHAYSLSALLVDGSTLSLPGTFDEPSLRKAGKVQK